MVALETNSLKKYHAFIFKICSCSVLIHLIDVDCHCKLQQQDRRLCFLLSNSLYYIQDVIMGINFKNAVYRFQLFLHVTMQL